RRSGVDRRLPVRLQRFDPDVPRVCDRQADVARSQRRQRVGDVRGREPLYTGREQPVRACGSVTVRLSRKRPFPHRRQRLAELGASCHQQWPAVRPKSGPLDGIRYQAEMKRILLGFVLAFILIAVGGYVFITTGHMPMATSAGALPFEETVAK